MFMSFSFTPQLLHWYQENKRDLPWRFATPDPYKTWLSEMMLQQTTVQTVIPYYLNFLERWPTVYDLAAASLDEVLHGWQGLGYYSRARNLHACARVIVNEHQGHFPNTISELLKLPGIGPYSAGAILSIGFEKSAIAIDGNVLRVISRYCGLVDLRPTLDRRVRDFLEENLSADHPGDFTQSLMEMGATLCRPKNPACDLCPVKQGCVAASEGDVERYPTKIPKAKIPTKYATAFLAINPQGDIFMRKRPQDHMLGGMMEIPTTPWELEIGKGDDALKYAPFITQWSPLDGIVKHTFSHFHFEIRILTATVSRETNVREPLGHPAEGVWVSDPKSVALPTVMKKILHAADKSLRMGA